MPYATLGALTLSDGLHFSAVRFPSSPCLSANAFLRPLMAHSRHFYDACLDHHTADLLPHPDPKPSAFRLRLSRLQQELAEFETRCVETRLALDFKTSESHAMKEHVGLLQAQLLQSDQVVAGVKAQLWGLEEEVAQLQADQVALQLQLGLESANHARDEEEWISEREELRAQIAHLETELRLADCSDGELDFLITPAKKGHLDRALSSSGTLHGLSLQTLLDMGEASLEVEDDIHELKMRLGESEARERTAVHELALKNQQLEDLKFQITQLKEDVAAEKDKAKEEAEDLTQEMAELRYQLMEMIEQERELRAQTEQASVLRVVELESQVKSARQEVVQALASRREAEMQSDQLGLEIQHMRLSLENAEQELKGCKEKIRHAEAEVEQSRKDVSSATEARLKLKKQLLESQMTRNSLLNENQQLKASLDRAVATTSDLAGHLRDKEAALHALIAKQSGDLKNKDEAENSYEDLSVEQSKNKEFSSHELVEIQEDVRDEQVENHEGTPYEFVPASDQGDVQLEGFLSPSSSNNSSDAEVSGITGVNQLNYESQDMFLNKPDVRSEGHAFGVDCSLCGKVVN